MKKYDHYLALDWAQSNMAIAHAVKDSNQIETIDVVSDLIALKNYLAQFKGSKILTFEETSPAQWLYTELIGEVDEIIVCEPYANHLMKTGPKTDRVDAIKLLKLLRADMLKPVFHCTGKFVHVRKIVSAYEDLIHSIVQLKNRKNAIFRARGQRIGANLELREDRFVVENLEAAINLQEQIRLRYEAEFRAIHRENPMVKNLATIPGIGLINSVKIAATVIDPSRFRHKTGFWLYCGLQKYELISGGRSYGKRSPRFSRKLKCVFKTAALVCTRMKSGQLKDYYEDLIVNRKYPEHQARHAVARRIAALSLGVMKSNKEFELKIKAC